MLKNAEKSLKKAQVEQKEPKSEIFTRYLKIKIHINLNPELRI